MNTNSEDSLACPRSLTIPEWIRTKAKGITGEWIAIHLVVDYLRQHNTNGRIVVIRRSTDTPKARKGVKYMTSKTPEAYLKENVKLHDYIPIEGTVMSKSDIKKYVKEWFRKRDESNQAAILNGCPPDIHSPSEEEITVKWVNSLPDKSVACIGALVKAFLENEMEPAFLKMVQYPTGHNSTLAKIPNEVIGQLETYLKGINQNAKIIPKLYQLFHSYRPDSLILEYKTRYPSRDDAPIYWFVESKVNKSQMSRGQHRARDLCSKYPGVLHFIKVSTKKITVPARAKLQID